MRRSTFLAIALPLVSAVCLATASAEDKDLVLRIDSAFESAEKARTNAALQIHEDAEKRARELENRLAEVKKWTTAQFRLGERGEIDKPKVMTALMKSWQTGQEREIYKLLEFPEKAYGEIESGRALNDLLGQVGPAAQQNEQTRRIDPARALPLHEATANLTLDEDSFSHLTIQNKGLGSRDSRRGNGDPIDIDWPAALLEDRWADHRAAVQKARARVLEEMSRTDGVSNESDQQLRDAVGALNADFKEYRIHWRDGKNYTHEAAAAEFHRVFAGQEHINKLIGSVYFVLEARNLAEMPQREAFHGGNVEEFLAYMVRNNLQFGKPSKDTDRPAYHKVFNLIVRYYLDEAAMAKIQRDLEQEIDQQKALGKESSDVALGKTMSANMQAALTIEEMKYVRDLIKD